MLRREPLSIPQEIIDQIVDELACQFRIAATSDYSSRPMALVALEGLRACALVSKPFSYPARRHLLSSVIFVVDRYGQRRAARLVKILERAASNDPLLGKNFTFSLIFNLQPTSEYVPRIFRIMGLSKAISKSRTAVMRTLAREKNMHKLLETLRHTPLVHLSIGAQDDSYYHWNKQKLDIDDKILRILANPSLRTLRLDHLMYLPKVFLQHVFCYAGLKELSLCNISFLESNTSSSISVRAISALETLEIRHSTIPVILSVMRSLHSPDDVVSVWPTTLHSFSHLHKLEITFPSYVASWLDSCRELIHAVAPFLETLDVRLNVWPDPFSGRWPIRLSSLTSLRCLHITSISFTPWPKRDPIIGLLSSTTAPMSLQSILINLYVRYDSSSINSSLESDIGWEELDNALSSTMFLDLKWVTCTVRPFCSCIPLRSAEEPVRQIDPTCLFPRTASSPTIELRMRVEPVVSKSFPFE